MSKISLNQSVNFIGAGKLGKVIAKLINDHQLGYIQGVCNSSLASSKNAINFIGAGKAYETLSELPFSDITFITVPDDKIKTICEKLIKSNILKPNSIVVHCSGSLPSCILNSAKLYNCVVASVHPICSFANAEQSIANFPGTFCALEGDKRAVTAIKQIFNNLGAKTFPIKQEKKMIYHAAGVFASNYLVTLANIATECLIEADLSQDLALEIILNLMEGTVRNIKKTKSLKKSLTGPLSRGDISILQDHLSSFKTDKIKKLYKELILSTLPLTDHDETLYQEIYSLIQMN